VVCFSENFVTNDETARFGQMTKCISWPAQVVRCERAMVYVGVNRAGFIVWDLWVLGCRGVGV
jgi:hypothetical protein